MKGRRSERIKRSTDEFIGIFLENSGTSENEEWTDTEEDGKENLHTPVSTAGKRIKLISGRYEPLTQPRDTKPMSQSNQQLQNTKAKESTPSTNLQIKLKMPRKTSPPPQEIKLPRDMDPEPVCPICLKIIIGDLDEINEHVDECIGPSPNVSSSIISSGTVTPLASACMSLVNVDEDDFGYGKDQYTEAEIERIMKCDTRLKKLTPSQRGEEEQETKAALLIQSILKTVPPSEDFAALQAALKSLLDRIALAPKCAVCWETLKMPAAASVNCWHVCCEECWLRTLGTKRLCPHCSTITNPSDLRKVFF